MRHRSLLALGALAFVLTACPAEETTPPGNDATPTPTDPAAATCTNVDIGFSVEYPGDWTTNDDGELAACSAFDPRAVTIPAATDIPTDIAVVIRAEAATFATLADPADDAGVDVLERQDTTIDGRSGAILDLEATGEGLHADGLVTYRYVVELDDNATLVAETHDVTTAEPSFEERRGVLDDMMQSLAFTDDGPVDAIEPLDGDATTDQREAEGASPMVSLVDVQTATHDGFDRIVFEIGGEGEAGWLIRYDDDPRTAGKGDEVDVEGEFVLAVTLTNIAMPVEPDQPEGVEPWDEDRVDGPANGIIVEAVNDPVFEGHQTIYVGLDIDAAFLVERFEDPQRIVIDLVH